MKELFVVLALIPAACSALSACGEVQLPAETFMPSPSPSYSADAVTSATLSDSGSGEPTGEEEFDYEKIDEVNAYLREYYSDEIEEADKYRKKIGDTLYYFDTSMFLATYPCNEFPLYRHKDGDFPEYLGTTGFAFQVFGDYIYVQSDPFQEDWPDGTVTRVVNLKDLSITRVGRNINIFIPQQGSKVYYTRDADCIIYIADASLKNVKKLHIKIPDEKIVNEKVDELISYDFSQLVENVGITNVENGWIYFTYWMFEYEGGVYYEGDYRIKTDGSKIERIGEGKFGDEIETEED